MPVRLENIQALEENTTVLRDWPSLTEEHYLPCRASKRPRGSDACGTCHSLKKPPSGSSTFSSGVSINDNHYNQYFLTVCSGR